MLNVFCGKLADNLRLVVGKTGARPSTIYLLPLTSSTYIGVQAAVVRSLFLTYALPVPPLKVHALPLVEHYLYPVSTTPTNSVIKGKIKKGNN